MSTSKHTPNAGNHVLRTLRAEELYRRCDPAMIPFESTASAEEFNRIVGQDRAVAAMQLAASLPVEGYNVFVHGPSGTGRHEFVQRFLSARARHEPTPSDWCYVNNFAEPLRPIALELPPGRGRELARDLVSLIDEIETAIPAAFQSEDYRNRRQLIEESFADEQQKAFEAIEHAAEERSLGIIRTPEGFAFAPVRDGETLSREDFEKLGPEEKKRIEAETSELQKQFLDVMREAPQRIRIVREKLNRLDRDVAEFTVGAAITGLLEKYAGLPQVGDYLNAMRRDVVEHLAMFRPRFDQTRDDERRPSAASQSLIASGGDPPALRRYGVNVIVDNSQTHGAPVISEDHPAYQYLIGRTEHMTQMGALVTDFTLIRAGALHRANGGYLILDAQKVLTQPFAWEGLKQALSRGRLQIRALGEMYSLVSTVALEPEPIPLATKVVLIGSRAVYYALEALDPEFATLFKVAADFNEEMERDRANVEQLALLVAAHARRHGLRTLSRESVARVIEESARRAGDSDKLSTEIEFVGKLVAEAHYWAGVAGHEAILPTDVQRAVDAQIERQSRVRDRIRETILRETLLIDTAGTVVGQVNGLAVAQVGDFSFGRPTRITARVAIGPGKVIDIEREAELGQPIHSKGVLILTNFLASHFVADRPLSLSASLVFEQSYGPVEGDSASSAELCALLSALARVPIDQALAITGSVNQYGRIQAIGGVNEKIEGFFAICAAKGLTGAQGVIIPSANVKHLMLRREVIDAVEAGRFRICAVESIDDCLHALTGVPAGQRDANGVYPDGTVYAAVTARLIELADKRLALAKAIQAEAPDAGKGQ